VDLTLFQHYPIQSPDPGDVNQDLGLPRAALQLNDQVGSPGDNASSGAMLGQEGEGIFDAGRGVIHLPHG
jgi:hypothetical protein